MGLNLSENRVTYKDSVIWDVPWQDFLRCIEILVNLADNKYCTTKKYKMF